MMMAVAIIGALVAPITLTLKTGATASTASAVVTSSAQQADPAARAIASQQHVTLAEAETRLSWQQAVPSLNTALSSQLPAAIFGGIWIATNDSDRVKVGVVDLTPHNRAVVMQAARSVGLSGATDPVPVKYSLDQLVSADTWLASQLDELSPRKADAIHLDAGYRTDLNRVQLSVAGQNLTAAERSLVSRAKTRYGDLIQVVAQPAGTAVGTTVDCVRTPAPPGQPLPAQYCYPPLRGGIEISTINTSQSQQVFCTGGFIASSRIDGKLYEFTAGHCAFYGGTGNWVTEFPDNTMHVIGTEHHYVFGTGGDMAILNINNPTGWQLPQGWVYVLAGTNTTLNERYPISSAQYSTVGARICETGVASGSKCGTVLGLGYSELECDQNGNNCVRVNNLGEDSIASAEGDSGGPVYAANQAFGLVSAISGNVTFYQGIRGASDALNVNIVLAH